MPLVTTDWTVTRSTKVIAYIGDDHGGASPSYATVIEFHRWLQDLADDAVAVGDDELDITNIDPSRRSTDNIVTLINGYTISAAEAEHLYDGSVIYSGGNEIYDGIVNFGNADVQIQIIQDGAVLADDWWNFNDAGLNADATAGISHRFMIKTRTAGSDIDGRRLIGTARRFQHSYAEFTINGSSRGNNVLALTDSLDLNNETAELTVAGWTSIVNNNEGHIGLDVDNNGADEFYYSEWDRDVFSINQFYERMKYLTRDPGTGSITSLYGLNGELFRGITHQLLIVPGTGSFIEPEPLSWGSGGTAGTGQLFAIDEPGTGSILWMQLLTGVIPSNNIITGVSGSAVATHSGSVIERTLSTPFVGASTGTAIIGSYGLGIEVLDLTSNDKVTDLDNNLVVPPNFVTNTVAGLISGEDRVLVAPWDGSTVDVNGDPAITRDQLSLSGNLTTDNITSIVVAEVIPSDTPNTGYIRVTDDNGLERRIHYASFSVSTFTIDETDGNEDFAAVNATSGNDIYIAYIDVIASGTTATFTSVQSGSRNLVAIVRDGGGTPIKQFISAWSQTSSNQTITVIRTTDA